MHRRFGTYTIMGLLLIGGLTACADTLTQASGDISNLADSISEQNTATLTVVEHNNYPNTIAGFQNTPTPTPGPDKPAEPDKLSLTVWWPDELYPKSGSTAGGIFDSQIDGFMRTYPSYDLEVRQKRSSGLGGILPTMQTAKPVAPNALPDLTLMRRSDMLTAAAERLIVPLDDWAPSDLMDNSLIPNAIALGEIDGVLFGVPYALNLYHTIYRESAFDGPLQMFEDVLDQQPVYLFPAKADQNSQVNWSLLLQYWAAGGTLVTADGTPWLDGDVLNDVLAYYQAGIEAGIFDAALLDYEQPEDYWTAFVTNEANMAFVDSTTYLRHKNNLSNIGLAPLPTSTGATITTLDGWMWVLTTQDPDRQDRAEAFLSWMMRVNQHGILTEALGILPSQQRAMASWDDQTYAGFAQNILGNTQIIPQSQRNNAAAAALQASLLDVFNGVPADVAADTAVAKLEE
ncbi:MAG: extracellular solute-binding protein [Anaerolineae bacterium]|nr:extracellular solute-binding protein [Anaerolineae bacterium]